MGDDFTSSLVSPVRGDALEVEASHVAQEWVSEHMLQRHGEKDAEARMNRQVAERLAIELRSKCELVTRLQQANEILEARMTDHQALATKVPTLEVENRELRSTLSSKTELHRHSEHELDGTIRDVQELRQQNISLHQQLNEKSDVLNRQKDGYAHLLEVSRKVASQNQVLNGEAERLGALVPSLKRESNDLKEAMEAIQHLREENHTLRETAACVDTLTEEVETLRREAELVYPLQQERAVLITACEKITKEVPDLNVKIDTLTRECNRVPQMEAQLERLDHEISKSQALENEVERLHEALRVATKERSALRDELQSSTTTCKTLHHRLPQLEEELHKMTKMAHDVPGLHALRDHLSQACDDLARRYEIDVAERDQRIAVLETQLNTAELSLRDQLVTVTEPLAAECERLKTRVTEYDVAVAAQRHLHQEELNKAHAVFEIQKADLMKKLSEKDALIEAADIDRKTQITALQHRLEEQQTAIGSQRRDNDDVQMLLQKNIQLHNDLDATRNAFQKAKSTVESQATEVRTLKDKLLLTMKGAESVTRESAERERKLQVEVERLKRLQKGKDGVEQRSQSVTGVSGGAGGAAALPSAAAALNLLPESPKIAPPRQNASSAAPHTTEVAVLRRHLAAPNTDIQAAAAETEALGLHPPGYWSENACRRTKVWMSQPLQC